MAATAITIIILTFEQRGKNKCAHSFPIQTSKEGTLAMALHLRLQFRLNGHHVRKAQSKEIKWKE